MSEDKTIEGNHNIFAGGNVSINEQLSTPPIREQLESLFDAIDSRMLTRYGEIKSQTRAGEEDTFSCQKMMKSLIRIGIPHSAAIDVIEGVESTIIEQHGDESKLSTADIRKCVQLSIYNLRSSIYGENYLQLWGDNYIRRYGDSNRRLVIINEDESISFLSFSYLRKTLIPNLIKHVYGVKLGEVDKLITANEIKPISENILEHAKGLNLCFIRYETLFSLGLDLATQPPHPWLVNDDTAKRIIEYDLERAIDHNERMHKYINTEKIYQCWHSIDECLYHSCSMVLAYYRMFIGCSPSAPPKNLLHTLKLNHEGYSSNLWESSRISQIESDMTSLGYDFTDLVNQIERILMLKNTRNQENRKLFYKEVSTFYEFCIDLIGHRLEVERLLLEKKYSKKVEPELLSFVQSIFLKVKGLRIREDDLEMKDGMFWVRHKINSAVFRNVAAKILVVPVPPHVTKNQKNYKLFIPNKIEFLESSGQYVDTAIFLTFDDDIEVFRESVRRECGRGYRTIVTSVFNFLKISQAKNRSDAFEDIFTDC